MWGIKLDRKEFGDLLVHEIKTPIASINGYADLIRHGMCDDFSRLKYADKIYKETVRLSNLVDDINMFCLLKDNCYEMNFENRDIYQITKEVVTSLLEKYSEYEIDICIDGNANAVVDYILIKKAIYELVENAINYGYNKNSSSAYANIVVKIVDSDDRVTISVSDKGTGIKKRYIEPVNELFFRVDKKYSRQIGGNGIGIPLVSIIAKNHNGKFEFYNNESGGLTAVLSVNKKGE